MANIKVTEIIKEVRNAGTPRLKMRVLEKYKDNELLQKIIECTYNPYKKYGISKNVFKKMTPTKTPLGDEKFFDWLEILAESNINNDLRQRIVNYVNFFTGDVKDLMIGIITKDLKLGVSTTTFNKVWPGLIPVFEVQLAAKYQNVNLKENEEIWVTEKLDGIRCACFICDGTIIFRTRQGKTIGGLIDIENDIKSLGLFNMVLDGELLYSGCAEDSCERYLKTVSIVNSNMKDKKEVSFNVFDIIPINEFIKGESSQTYVFRRNLLDTFPERNTVKVTPVLYHGNDHTMVMKLLNEMIAKKREGVMVNRNHNYQCKRTTSLLKVKKMNDCDLRVIGYKEGNGENEGKLGALLVDYKGYVVNVGAGYTKKECEDFWKSKEDMIGKIIKVRYFEETKNKHGELSLRFPIFVEVRNDKNEPSYE